jgi:hypothetical protein
MNLDIFVLAWRAREKHSHAMSGITQSTTAHLSHNFLSLHAVMARCALDRPKEIQHPFFSPNCHSFRNENGHVN